MTFAFSSASFEIITDGVDFGMTIVAGIPSILEE